MTKIRIYELAKELGVENKVIIQKATELGLAGKASHSSSLEGDEAQQIRRAMIRSALGGETETVTTRIDKLTGESEAIVERRKGNVIRRRKQGEGGPASGPSVSTPSSQPSLQASGIQVVASEPEEELIAKSPEVEPSGNGHPAPKAPAGIEDESEEAKPSKIEARASEVEVAEPKSQVEVPPAPSEEESKKTIGPKVLGKIELPQKKAASPAQSKAEKTYTAAPNREAASEEDEDESKGKKAEAKKKGRKREISRIDLIDYEGREGRRTPRPSKTTRTKDEVSPEKKQQETTKTKASKRVVKMSDAITVGELARQMSVKAGEVIAKLMELGVLATINQMIDKDTATIICEEFEFQIESTDLDESDILVDTTPVIEGDLQGRPPVVTVMGHVDHGKTSLLDTIRQTSVAAKEHGGITQHIGAYNVTLEDGRSLTFIDTPGHAAFTSMRARGAQVTDMVVLVVAVDDGVMPQTIEAINHAKAAKVSMVVAINKIDKQGGNQDRIKQQLAEHGVQPEDWGGDTMFFPVSALKKQGIKELLEGILLVAEVKELKANPNRRAAGTIIESRQDKGRGTVATILVQTGTLRIGDVFVSGAEYGRVRSMLDDRGEKIEAAGPSVPVEITGFNGFPVAGDDFVVVETEAKSKQVALQRSQKKQISEQRAYGGPISLEEFSLRANNLAAQELNLILKADVHGSLEAASHAIEKLSTPKVRVKVVHAGVGGINESDIQLAIAAKAIVVGFGVRGEARALSDAESLGVELRFYRVIYELLDDVKKAMAGLLAPIKSEVRLGRVEVRDTFNVPKMGTVAGCFVQDGVVKRGSQLRLLRDSKVVHEGKMASLRRFKDDVREVQSGYECGIMIEGFNDLKPGDMLEVFEIKETAAVLE